MNDSDDYESLSAPKVDGHKYKVLDEKHESAEGYFRIQANTNIPEYMVFVGDKGGFVMGEHNLSQEGCAWIADDGMCGDDACVYDDALVRNTAQVIGGSRIGGQACVCGHANVRDEAVVDGKAIVMGHAVVCEMSRVGGNAVVDGSSTINGNTVLVTEFAVMQDRP